MNRTTILSVVVLALCWPVLASATPPDHAPAHGYRAKHKKAEPAPSRSDGGFKIVFDSERGVHVVVGLPDIIFHDGKYYRERDGGWQVSVSGGDSGWSFSASTSVPDKVRHAKVKGSKAQPGPAKHGKKKK